MDNQFDLDQLLAGLSPNPEIRPDYVSDMSPTQAAPPSPSIPVPPPIAMPKRAPAVMSPPATVPEPEPAPDVNSYIKQKFNLGNLSDENRQSIVDENAKYDLGGRASAALAALGAGISGGNAASAGNSILARKDAEKKAKLDAFDKSRADYIQNYGLDRQFTKDTLEDDRTQREMNLNSQESQLAQSLAKQMIPSMDFSKMNAQQINEKIPALKSLYEGRIQLLEEHNKALDRKAILGLKGSEGQMAVDKDYAKDYNDWTSGARGQAETSINKLENVIGRLQNKKGTTGTFSGLLPDRFTSDELLQNRADVQSEAMKLIKQNLSGATSDKDVERTIKTLWNESDSTENNVHRINNFLNTVRSRVKDNDAKAQYYEKNGSLRGFKSSYGPVGGGDFSPDSGASGGGKQIVKQQRNKRTGQMKITYSDGSEEIK